MANPKCKLFRVNLEDVRVGNAVDLDDQFNQWVEESGENISVISIHPNRGRDHETLYALYYENPRK